MFENSRGRVYQLKRPRGLSFSLVELLVVIAILALLFSLLSPALAGLSYRGLNLQCMNNQRQINIGIAVYAEDFNSYYPVTPTDVYDNKVAPHQIATFNFDFRLGIRSYFGDELKSNWVCPQAPEEYTKGGALNYANRDGIDIDGHQNLDHVVTSYSHFYGRRISGTGSAYWGAGGDFFFVTQGMEKIGDTQRFNCPDTEYDSTEFRLMTSDVLWYHRTRMKWLHETPNAHPNERGYYNEYSSLGFGAFVDFNYTTEDGASLSLSGLGHEDPRVTNSMWDPTRGWVLPLPEELQE